MAFSCFPTVNNSEQATMRKENHAQSCLEAGENLLGGKLRVVPSSPASLATLVFKTRVPGHVSACWTDQAPARGYIPEARTAAFPANPTSAGPRTSHVHPLAQPGLQPVHPIPTGRENNMEHVPYQRKEAPCQQQIPFGCSKWKV